MHSKDAWKCEERLEVKREGRGNTCIKRESFGRTQRIKKSEAIVGLQHYLPLSRASARSERYEAVIRQR